MTDLDHGASELQRVWERHGQSRWGYGVALSVRALEGRVAALEKLVTAIPSGSLPADLGDGVSPSENDKNLHHTTDPGEGWRLLEPSEEIRAGDEFFTLVGWKKTRCVGHRQSAYMTYRRRIEQTAPPCVETDGSSPRNRVPPAADIGSGEVQPPGVPQPDNGLATGGRGHNTEKPFAWAADIPGKYGGAPTVLFGYTESLVKSIAATGGDSVSPFPLYRTPQPHATPGECSEPVLWAVCDMETGRPLSAHLGEKYAMEAAGNRIYGSGATQVVVPLYGQPHTTLTDEERKAIGNAINTLERWQQTGGYHSAVSEDAEALRGLLERLG